MSNVRVIDVNQSIFADNDAVAAEIREKNQRENTFMINLMASPGSGKTSVLLRTLEALKDEYKIGVMEADIEASVKMLRKKLGWIIQRAHLHCVCENFQ